MCTRRSLISRTCQFQSLSKATEAKGFFSTVGWLYDSPISCIRNLYVILLVRHEWSDTLTIKAAGICISTISVEYTIFDYVVSYYTSTFLYLRSLLCSFNTYKQSRSRRKIISNHQPTHSYLSRIPFQPYQLNFPPSRASPPLPYSIYLPLCKSNLMKLFSQPPRHLAPSTLYCNNPKHRFRLPKFHFHLPSSSASRKLK